MSADNESIFAVPSMNKSLNSKPEAPKSLLSVEGTISLSNLPVAVVYQVALPRLTSPLKFDVPASVVIPVILRFLPVISSYDIPQRLSLHQQ